MQMDRVNAGQHIWLRAAAVLCVLTIVSLPFHMHVLPNVISEGTLPIGHAFGQTFHEMYGPIMQTWGPNGIFVSILSYGVLSAFDLLAGNWLWKRQKKGANLALVLLPLYWFFAVGWGVPYMMLVGVLRASTLALGWKSVRTTMRAA